MDEESSERDENVTLASAPPSDWMFFLLGFASYNHTQFCTPIFSLTLGMLL